MYVNYLPRIQRLLISTLHLDYAHRDERLLRQHEDVIFPRDFYYCLQTVREDAHLLPTSSMEGRRGKTLRV